MKIKEHKIGGDNPCFIIAELSANHGGDINIAKSTIEAAKRTGADAVKIQTFTPDTITLDVDNEDFKISQGTLWDGRYLHDLYKEAFLPWEWHQELFAYAEEIGITCFSSPFDPTAVELLETIETPAYKIASFEITDLPLIKLVASKMKPVILSTGIATLEDIEMAINACKEVGNDQIVLLKCTSSYPAPIDEANLLMMEDFKERFDVTIGLSDHTLGIVVPVVATALGAKVIEKHFILDKAVGGPDASFSLDEREFTELVKSIRSAEMSLGNVSYELTEKQLKGKDFRRSLYVAEDIKKGQKITNKNVRSVRPGFGLHPKHLESIIGKKVNRNIDKGTRMKLEYVDS